MLDFRNYFTEKNATDNKIEGDFFTAMMKTIIAENAKHNNKDEETILTELAALETNNFRQFKSAIEEQIKMWFFNHNIKLLREWEVKNIMKINAVERKEKYTERNVPDGKFRECYRIFQPNNDYFNNGNYHNTITTQLSEKLQQLKMIYQALDKESDFQEIEILLELIPTFQECPNPANNKAWEIMQNQEINMLKSSHATIEIKLQEQLNKKIIAKSKISKFRNFIIKFFTGWQIDKHKQFDQEIAIIKKQLQTNKEKQLQRENNETVTGDDVKAVINESNTLLTTSNNQHPVVSSQSRTL